MNKKQFLERAEWMYQLAAYNTNLRMGARQLVPVKYVLWEGGIPKGDAIKLEHLKVMVQQSIQSANLVATKQSSTKGKKLTQDFIGLTGLRDAHFKVMDKVGNATNTAGLYRLALLEPGILKQYRTVESGFKETLYDEIMRKEGKIIELLGSKEFAKLVKDTKLLDKQNKVVYQ